MTVATHHPWKTPEGFDRVAYMGSDDGLMSNHEALNSFLNTVAFIDRWVGQILKHLDEAKIADKTLVVMVGDQ
jgi:arylsulfatase A-like enzyme